MEERIENTDISSQLWGFLMSSIVEQLTKKELIRPPSWLPNSIQYECVMGSIAYGVAEDTSDYDVYGFCIPKKEMVFPHLAGEISGFGRQIKRFDNYQQHHIEDKSALKNTGRNYDLSIFSIIRYFHLLMENNPNVIDSLFVPRECILFTTKIGELVRENRKIFLHKGCFHRFKGYAFSQAHRMKGKNPVGKRVKIREEKGFDVKFAYHIVRLCDECQQILETHDLNLQRAKEQMKAVRKGEWTEDEVLKWFSDQEIYLEELYHKSTLPYGPDESKIKELLLKCLEEYFGSLDKCIVNPEKEKVLLQQIAELTKEYL